MKHKPFRHRAFNWPLDSEFRCTSAQTTIKSLTLVIESEDDVTGKSWTRAEEEEVRLIEMFYVIRK